MGSEYDVVPLRPGWGALSVLSFAIALFSRPILRAIPISVPLRWVPAALLLGILVPGTVGLLMGVIGLRRSPSTGTAKIGIFLNGVAIACVLVVIAGYLVWSLR